MREVISNELFTILIVLGLCILAFAKYAFSNRFSDYLWVIGNSKYLKIYAREQKFIDQFDSLLFVNLIISLSIFSFVGYNTFVDSLPFDLTTFIKLFRNKNIIFAFCRTYAMRNDYNSLSNFYQFTN